MFVCVLSMNVGNPATLTVLSPDRAVSNDDKCGLQGVAYAKEYAVANGPIILEMDTYRYHGHSMSDPGSTYRTRDEITQIRTQRDPVEHVRKLLLDRDLLDTAGLKKIEKVRASPHLESEEGSVHPCQE